MESKNKREQEPDKALVKEVEKKKNRMHSRNLTRDLRNLSLEEIEELEEVG